MRLLALALAAVGLFEEVPPSRSGISLKHAAGRSAARHLPESVGVGAALLDYDNDGWLDLYLVNSGATDFYQPERPLRNALYRNNGNGTFTDRTQQAGVAGGTYGMGAAAGDYDNDGDADLLVTAHGPVLLYRNNGDGTFTEVAAQAGVRVEGWTTSAVWFDYDADKWLDLFVCSFARYRAQDWSVCGQNADGLPFYCIPRRFEPAPSYLFRNNGDGTFTETGRGTAIGNAPGKALGVVTTDVNNDRRLDLFVSNDTVQNFLFVNRAPAAGKPRWEEAALPAEVAYSADGQARSGMGVDAADWDEDGWEDLLVSNVDHEAFSLYRNLGGESYADLAPELGLAQATRLLSGWGLRFLDFNNDGTLDLVLANGHPDDMIERHKRNVFHREPLLLFANIAGRLQLAFEHRPMASRGLAVGDWNNDGRTDLLVVNNDEPPALLENRAGGNWIGLKLQGVQCNRDAIGALVAYSVNGAKRTRRLNAGGSYLSSHDLRLILGIGAAAAADWVEVRWPAPSSRVQRFVKVPAGRYYTLKEGQEFHPVR